MPAKSKKTRPEWNQCVACKLIIHGKNIDKHVEICGQDELCPEFGYIVDSTLWGVTAPYNKSKFYSTGQILLKYSTRSGQRQKYQTLSQCV